VRRVLDTITSGQELDLQRFQGATAQSIVSLQSAADLDDYTYRVAGCVGEFWTKMCVSHVFARMGLPELAAPEYQDLGVRFGKGLQLVNILRDLPADLRKGRCYLPEDKLAELGVRPADLLLPMNETKFRPMYNDYLDQAESHLGAGWEYTNQIPYRCLRLRLACAWPVLIGIRTLRRLRGQNVLDPAQRIKITRAELRRVLLKSVLTYPLPFFWRRQFG